MDHLFTLIAALYAARAKVPSNGGDYTDRSCPIMQATGDLVPPIVIEAERLGMTELQAYQAYRRHVGLL